MNRIVRIATMTVAALSLAACLLPEKFETSIRFKPDGGYSYKYDGTAVHFIAAAAIQSLPPASRGKTRRRTRKA